MTDWMKQVHEEIVAIGGYTAAAVTAIGIVVLIQHRHIKKILIEFNGKDRH